MNREKYLTKTVAYYEEASLCAKGRYGLKTLGLFFFISCFVWLKQVPGRSQNLPNFSQSPTKQEWQHFMKMKALHYKLLWESQHAVEMGFSTWSWEWKLGWLRTCHDRSGYCHDLLVHALQDSAAVVRSRAALKVRRLYYETQDSVLIKALQEELQAKRNLKFKKTWPLMKQLKLAQACIKSRSDVKKVRNRLAKVCMKR